MAAQTKAKAGKAQTPDKLAKYQAKRNFEKTAEPSGEAAIRAAEYPRFVIQKHDATRLHYDLRLEVDGVFKSWAVTRGPSLDPNEKRLAVEVEDHPLDYGDFEGTIPKGEYGGGTVMLWDRGFWSVDGDKPAAQALEDGELKFNLAGTKLQGNWVIVRMKPRAGDKHNNWLLIKHRDQWSKDGDGETILQADRSVASKRTMEAIAAGKGDGPAPFMLAKRVSAKPDAIWNSRPKSSAAPKASKPSVRRKPPAIEPVTAQNNVVDGITISHPDKILWPAEAGADAFTKLQLAEYLATVGPWMIEHLRGIPCSLLRAPDGITKQTFFQRHAMAGMSPTVSTVKVRGEKQPYIQFDDAKALVAMGQMAALEFHPWNCAPFEPAVPGRLVFDLDPAPEVEFAAVVDAALEVSERLAALGLHAFCKTTGGKGLHVVTPLEPDAGDGLGWEAAKTFAQALVSQMADASPDRYLTKMTKKLRTGRIFLDYLRNDETATAVAPLSPRARPGATVSMPLDWDAVKHDLDPKAFTIATAPTLLSRSNAWADYGASAQPLKRAIEKLVGGR